MPRPKRAADVIHRANLQTSSEGEERTASMSVEVTQRVVEALSTYFPLKSDFDRALAEIRRSGLGYRDSDSWSISKTIRGLMAREGKVISEKTRDEDIGYTKALVTGSGVGSYIVPTLNANEIIAYLNTSGVARSAGVRVWPLQGVDKINIPTALAAPTVEYLGQNTAQTATDPNLGQISFSMKTARCLTAIPNELLLVSTPAIDSVLSELVGIAFAEAEDAAIFSTSAVTGGPTSTIYSVSGTTTYNVGNSANGGNLSYNDLTAVLWKSASAKAKAPFVWFMSPRTFYQRVLGLVDSQSRPIVVLDGAQGPAPGRLWGYPVFVSPAISESQAVGSGTNQSYAVLANPKYIHIGDGQQVEIAVSSEFYFSANQTAIRGVRRHDTQFSPAAGIVLLKGIN